MSREGFALFGELIDLGLAFLDCVEVNFIGLG